MTILVSLIGAGPGDPGLLTLRGARRIAEADTIVCDALVHEAALRHARPDAEVLVLGKRGGGDSAELEEILHVMLHRARQGRRVARVKGGDPMVFGRAAEELEFLAAHGVAFDVVAGVTAALGASATALIPLTHRALSSSVAFVTATERPERPASAHDWPRLATATQTLVIYMGLRNARATIETLVTHGRSADTPAAVVSHATLPSQRVVVARLGQLADLLDEAHLPSPALIIVGEVAALRERLDRAPRAPLAGRRVLVTRASDQSDALRERLLDEGAEVVVAPAIRVDPPSDPAPLRRALESLAAAAPDAIVFSSANAVERFFEALLGAGRDARSLSRAKVVSIGAGTSNALRRWGIVPDAAAPEAIGEGLAAALGGLLGGRCRGARVLFPRAEVARDEPVAALRALGATVEVAAAYRNVACAREHEPLLRATLEAGVDAALFFSASAVSSVCEALGDDAPRLLRGRAASLGPQTSKALRARGIDPVIEASKHDAEGLVGALRDHFREDRHDP